MASFDRYIRFMVGKENVGVNSDIYNDVGSLKINKPDIPFRKSRGFEVSNNLRMSIEIKRTDSSTVNNCTLKIWNLSEQTMELIMNNVDNVGIVQAGYLYGVISVIFVGDIVYAVPTLEGPDVILEINLAEGYKMFRNTTATLSYSKTTSLKKILSDVVLSFQDVKSNLNSVEIPDTKYESYSVSGNSKDILDKLLEQTDVTWFFQDDRIVFTNVMPSMGTPYPFMSNNPLTSQIRPREQSFYNGKGYYELSEDTGLIGSPKAYYDKDGQNSGGKIKQQNDGVIKLEVDTLLFPNARIGNFIILKSKYNFNKTYNNLFVIKSLTHLADNCDGDFMTRMEIHSVNE